VRHKVSPDAGILLRVNCGGMRVLIAALIAVFAGGCSSKTDTETFGNFRIETWRTDAFGHTGHSFKVFHNHGRSSHLVAERVEYFLDPRNPDRVLVAGCPDGKPESCALRYFDGATDDTHLVTRDDELRNGSPLEWSPDGRFLAVPGQAGLLILDLDNGEVFDAGEVLELQTTERKIDFTEVTWAPDGTLASVELWNTDVPPGSYYETDLLAIDPVASAIHYVATKPAARPSGPWYGWQPSGSGYSLAVLPGKDTFRKTPRQLPRGVIF
jgi:hypothetical protein